MTEVALKKFDHKSVDAVVWAKEFMRLQNKFGYIVDEETMVGWFANAIMAGFDEATRRSGGGLDKDLDVGIRNCVCQHWFNGDITNIENCEVHKNNPQGLVALEERKI